MSSDLSAAYMQAYLQSLPDIGSLQVSRSKDCAGYTWTVRWNSGGFQNPITVRVLNWFWFLFIHKMKHVCLYIKKITASKLQGNAPNITTQTVTIGGILFNPILGNMLRTYHSVPQVWYKFKNNVHFKYFFII